MRKIEFMAISLMLAVAPLAFDLHAQTAKKGDAIKAGSLVSLEYTLSDDKGKVIESNKGKGPLKYTHGKGQIIPGLEKELAGMKAGQQKKVRVKPEEGYGPVDPRAFKEFPRDEIPADGLKVGAQLFAQNPQGQSMPVRVREIKEKTVIIDFNHPLAGKILLFDVKVLTIEASQDK